MKKMMFKPGCHVRFKKYGHDVQVYSTQLAPHGYSYNIRWFVPETKVMHQMSVHELELEITDESEFIFIENYGEKDASD